MSKDSTTLGMVRASGEPVKEFPIEIGPRFLELFSENLYTSPNKAFEELVANSWDANATSVYISIPDYLNSDNASIWVLDNGISMDISGLETLWRITSDHKRSIESPKRPQIGKFGIGKLATYVLASEITYICKASDGKIRTVPVNYRDIEELDGVWRPDDVPLTVREISTTELKSILSTIEGSDKILDLISKEVPYRASPHFTDEFHHPDPPTVEPSETWTLALLTSLRETGRSIQKGRVRRMLRSALPLTSDVSIVLNDEVLEPTKVEVDPHVTWVFGRDLAIDDVEIEGVDPTPNQDSAVITKFDDGKYPHITIEGIEGKISGQITVYKSRISGGKSEDLGASNGFFVNILGRVVNQEKPDFGLENLSHGAWAQFRATVRADGLDCDLGVERNGLRDSRQVRIFKRFLMSTFNKARIALKDAQMTEWPKAGDILSGKWKSIPMGPLAEIVSERLASNKGMPGSIDIGEIGDFSEVQGQWNEIVDKDPGDLISAVKTAAFGQQFPFSQYKLQSRELLVNENHPYFDGRSSTIEERRIIQDFALANFLTELYLMRHNVDSVALDEGRAFRDEFLRLLAQLQRRTGAEIAQMLNESTTDEKALEVIVGDALDYIGFIVTRMGGKGEPEGIAQSPMTPNANTEPGSYSFSYDAKSTAQSSGRVSNEHVRPGSLARHRKDHSANYTLVVAPSFQSGALQQECKASKVTPMRAEDLAELLVLSATSGTVDFVEFTKVFELYDPDEVHKWVKAYIAGSKAKPHISVSALLEVFDDIGVKGPDELETSVIADRMRMKSADKASTTELQIRDAIEGLGVFLPSIVRINNKQVYLSAAPEDIRDALVAQLQLLPDSIRQRIDPEYLG